MSLFSVPNNRFEYSVGRGSGRPRWWGVSVIPAHSGATLTGSASRKSSETPSLTQSVSAFLTSKASAGPRASGDVRSCQPRQPAATGNLECPRFLVWDCAHCLAAKMTPAITRPATTTNASCSLRGVPSIAQFTKCSQLEENRSWGLSRALIAFLKITLPSPKN